MRANRLRRREIPLAQQKRCNDADCRKHDLEPVAHPERGEYRRRCEHKRPRQNFRQKPARKPEVLGPDPHLIEEESRRQSEHQNQRGRAPEGAPHDQCIADDGECKCETREIQIGEHANRMRVLRGQRAARLAEKQRVNGTNRDDRYQRRRKKRSNRRRHAWLSTCPDQRAGSDPGQRNRRQLDRVERLNIPDRAAEVRPQLGQVIHARRGNPRRQHHEEPGACSVAAYMCEQRRRDRSADSQHAGKAGEQGEPEQRRGDGPEEAVVVFVRVGVREQRAEEQRLRDDFRVRVARVPRLDDVHAEQAAAAAAGTGPIKRPAAKYTARTPRIAHHAVTRRVPVTPSNPYAMAIQTGYPCGNWPVTVPAIGIAQMKSHEANAVEVRVGVGRKKQVARRHRHRRRDAVGRHERSPLRDLNTLVHVHARVAPTQHVFSGRRGEIHPSAGGNQYRREYGSPVRPRERSRRGAGCRVIPAPERPQATALHHTTRAQRIRAQRGEHERDGRRDDDADDDRPEQAFFGRQRGTLRAFGNRQPEDDRAGQIRDRRAATRWCSAFVR